MGVPANAERTLSDVVSDLAAFQTRFKNSNGKYWQGSPVCPPPADGATKTPDTASRTDSERDLERNVVLVYDDWAETGITLPNPVDVSVSVGTVDRGNGEVGWFVVGEYIESGILNQKILNGTDAAELAHDWETVEAL